jgi:ABC-type transport system substrate-binding protein
MKQNKFMLALGFIVLVSIVLSACQPIVTTVTVEVTKEVKVVETSVVKVETTKLVESTKIVEVQRKAFTTPHPILSDLKVRQAIATCTNKLDLIKSVYPLVDAEAQKKLVLNSFIDGTHWAYAGDANLTIYPFSKDAGSKLLDEAGWKLNADSGFREKAGEPLSLKFTTTNATFRQTWAAVWEKQMSDCGIQITRFHVPSSWWFGDSTGLKRRDFELGAFAWVGEVDPQGQTLYACDQIPSPDNGWAGQNDMGWCNQKATTAIKLANNTLLQKDRVAQYLIVQQEYTKDLPAIPLFNRTNTYAYNPKLTGFNQAPGNIYWDWNIETWEIPGKDTIVLGLTQEPSTLYMLIVDAAVARIAYLPIGGSGGAQGSTNFVPGLNYTYASNLYFKQLPTLENGGAKNNDVDVKEGDKVVDADGNPVDLKAGVKVVDSTGATVEFKAGGTVKMKQLVVTFDLVSGIKWSDGQPLLKEDLELGYKHDCDKDSGATSYINCDNTAKYEVVSDTQAVQTLKPGVQSPLYYLPGWGWYPAHRVIADGANKGKKLSEVAAKDWAGLKEISESPIDTGPYIIKEWKKGQSISYEANPNFYKGKPKTPKIVVKFIDPANAEAQLIAGDVDILGDETLTAVTETLAKAEKAGKVKTLVVPSATWEHIDFSLFVK